MLLFVSYAEVEVSVVLVFGSRLTRVWRSHLIGGVVAELLGDLTATDTRTEYSII